MERRPVVAGSFYPASEENLKKQIEECFLHPLGPGRLPAVSKKEKGKILALISPHAGYMYSGPVAASGYLELAEDHRPEVFVIIGPNHTGFGARISVDKNEVWVTPLGKAYVDLKLANEILRETEIVQADEAAHIGEHSVEVQLPFLHYIYGDEINFLPLVMLDQSYASSVKLGKILGEVLKGKNTVVIASTDMTHYEPQEVANEKDNEALKHILALDEGGVTETVSRLSISMCGAGPVIATLVAAKELGANSAKLLSYYTSGDITGDYLQVVGYASVKLEGEGK